VRKKPEPKKWIRIGALTLTLLIVFPLALVAARWQWSRHFERQELNLEIENSISRNPLTIKDLSDIKLNFDEYTQVEMSGTFSEDTTWWRKQSLDGVPGFIALKTFILDGGDQIVVALGWSQTVENLESFDAEELQGRLRYIRNFDLDPSDIPNGQTNSPATVLDTDDHIYLEIIAPDVARLAKLPLPQITAGPHLGYVGQWILIAIFAVSVYVIALRNLPKES
jgi:cytochrome oxidase assembly protein ShyY1